MRFAIDIDGVIADTRSEDMLRIKYALGDDVAQSVSQTYRLSQSESIPDGWMRKQFNDPSYWLNAKPYVDAWYMLNKWFGQGHDVDIVTCRFSDTTVAATERWFDEWDIMYNRLYHSQTRLEKYKLITKLNSDISIDDDPEEAAALSGYTKSYLVNRVYNTDYTATRGAIRIDSLYDIDKIINP